MRTAIPWTTAGLLFVVLPMLGGCPAATPDLQSGRVAIDSMEGTWTAAAGDKGHVQLTINGADELTDVHVEPAGASLPIVPGTVVQLSGNTVAFVAEFQQNLGSMSFQGTLNNAGTSVTGTLALRSNTDTSTDDSATVAFVRQ